MTIPDLARYLAAAIFHEAMSDRRGDKCQRIAFKGGKYPDSETDLGGLCESALKERIEHAIQKRPRFLPDDPVGAAYDRIRAAMDLPADCAPSDVAKAVEETLSAYHALAGETAKAMEMAYPASTPPITINGM